MGDIRKPRIEGVITYLQGNADRNITYTEISEATATPRGTLSSVLSRLSQADPAVQKVAKGIVRYNSGDRPLRKGDTVLYEVVKDDGDKKLLQDENGSLWRITKFGEY